MAAIDPFLGELKLAQLAGQQVLAAAAPYRTAGGHRRRVDQHQRVVQLPVPGPGFPTAGGRLEHSAE